MKNMTRFVDQFIDIRKKINESQCPAMLSEVHTIFIRTQDFKKHLNTIKYLVGQSHCCAESMMHA